MADADQSGCEERPWGSWCVLDEGEGYKVKRIEVDPRRRLSLQTHAHRSEHWVVITGRATCVVGDRTLEVAAGESVDVAVGEVHRICNDTDEPLMIIEVQRGEYLGEDDIYRLQDDFDR